MGDIDRTTQAQATGRQPRVAVIALFGISIVTVLAVLWWAVLPQLGIGNPKMQTAAGVEEMVADLQDELGTTQVVEVSLYDSYAIVTVAVAGSSSRIINYRYAGDFKDVSYKSTRTDDSTQLIDLADVDAAAVLDRIAGAPAEVGLPGGSVLGVDIRLAAAPDGAPYGPYAFIYVDSEFGETGRLQLDLAGRTVDVDKVGE